MSDGRAPRRSHSDRGILEQYDGKFIKASARHPPALPSVFVPYTLSAMTRPTLLRRWRETAQQLANALYSTKVNGIGV